MNQWIHFASVAILFLLSLFKHLHFVLVLVSISFCQLFRNNYIYRLIYWVLSMWFFFLFSLGDLLFYSPIDFVCDFISYRKFSLFLSRVLQFDINKIETNMYFDDFWLNILCALCKISLIFFNFFVDFFFLLVFCIFIIAFFVVYNLQMCVCVCFFSVLIICFLNAFHLYERWSAFHLWNNLLHSHYFIIHRHLIILICKSMLHAIISFFTLHFVWIYINSN